MPRYRRNRDASDVKTVQKYKWVQKKRFDNFTDADTLRNELKKENEAVKVRRCGPNGTQFKVVVGVKVKPDKKSKVKKEVTNATE